MHEAMIAQGLLSAISAEAQKQNARPVTAKISCGELNAVNDDVLLFAFKAISEGTICEHLKLLVEHKPIEGKCNNCSRTFPIDTSSLQCPACRSDDFVLLPEPPLLLEEIEFETE